MPLDPTPNASLFSLAAELDARSAALHAAAYSSAPFLSQSNGTGTDTYQYPPDQIKVDKPPLRLQVPRRCVPEGTSVWDTVTWETRDAKIVDKDGNTVFEQRNVRVPSTWSQTAVNVVASKYFRLVNGVRETGVDQMIQRVSATITEWGIRDGYFEPETAAVFAAELQYLLLHQMSSFNSPVWFNIGVPGSKNQASACFIIDVEDSMESILEWYRQEGLIFQGGSGAGVNVSKVRSNGEPLSSGGTSSGILSFMKAADRSSGAIKSGGSVRRAAKMVQMDIDHPDIKAFITCKQHEEAKARILIAAGYDAGLDGEAYETVAFQNANHSVVVPDAFLRAVEADGLWDLTRRVDGAVTETVSARALFRLIAETAHSCGDPGVFFSDTANQWHTTPTQGPIRGTNPCSEFLRPPDEACNLSCLNLLKFLRDDGSYDIDLFTHAVDIMITAKEILVGHSNYPTEVITKNSHAYRTLGQGYANLGGLLMAKGLPYDSDAGRNYAASITALMTGEAYVQSARLASVTGPFSGFLPDKDAMMMIIQQHRDRVNHRETNWRDTDADLWDAASRVWLQAERLGYTHGYRNAQVSLLMPAGTVGLMMGCGTTGVEPDVALVNYKALVGGGTIKKVNEIVPQALQRLGYNETTIHQAQEYIEAHGTLEGFQWIQEKHLPVFDCAFPTTPGGRSIHWRGHMLMVAALQPFLSMGISKCVTGDTVITTNKGLKRIASFYDGEDPDCFRSLQSENIKVPHPDRAVDVSCFYYGGERDVWRVSLADGRTITGTATHRVLVAYDNGLVWQHIPRLNIGDFVSLYRGADMWGNEDLPEISFSRQYGSQHKTFTYPRDGSFRVGQFLGMLTADGHVVESNYVIGLTKNCPEVLERFLFLLENLFGIFGKKITDKRNGVTGVHVGSKSIQEWLRGIGFSKKHIPDCIFSGSRDMVLGYLSGLYLDGYITMRGAMAISQKNRSLLLDVQAVWDNLGIPTYFTHNVVNGFDYPVLHIAGGFRKKAALLLEWLEPHKKDMLSQMGDGQDVRVFPLHKEELLSHIREMNLVGKYRSCFDNRTRHLRKSTFFRIAKETGFPLQPIEQLYDYVQVVSVEYLGKEEVYDIAVPETETFIGNGIVNHNTINMPHDATVEDVEAAYLEAWHRGCKSIAIYRDGSKYTQVVTTRDVGSTHTVTTPAPVAAAVPYRRRLPDERAALTHKFQVGDQEGYLTVGLYDDGTPGEIFIHMSKEGSTISGLIDAFATSISMALQYGVPLQALCDKFQHSRFAPSGFTHHPQIRIATSVTDYIFRYLALKFLDPVPATETGADPVPGTGAGAETGSAAAGDYGAGVCNQCGGLLRITGNCSVCSSCGMSMGCS